MHTVEIVETRPASQWRAALYDWFCTCGDFGINYERNVELFAESHERVMNARGRRD